MAKDKAKADVQPNEHDSAPEVEVEVDAELEAAIAANPKAQSVKRCFGGLIRVDN